MVCLIANLHSVNLPRKYLTLCSHVPRSPHFSGNFWWAARYYVAKHHPPTHPPEGQLISRACKRWLKFHGYQDREYAEAWLLDSPTQRFLPSREHIGNCYSDLVGGKQFPRSHYRRDFDTTILSGVRCEEVYANTTGQSDE